MENEPTPTTTLTREQVEAWLVQEQAKENAEDHQIADELIAYAAAHGREIFAIVQCLPDGSAALPTWGVRKKRA